MHLVSDVNNKVKDYEDSFSKLKLALQERAVVQTEIVVLRVMDMVTNLGGYFVL